MTSVVAKLYNEAGTQIAELPNFSDVQIQDKLNDENAWTMKYDRGGLNFDQLIQDKDLSVKFFVDGSNIFEGVIEEDNWDEVSEDTSVTLAGRSWAGQFEFAKVYPQGGVSAVNDGWTFTNASPGNIFYSLLVAAQGRGTVTNLSVSFTTSTDSNGQPWANHLSITYKTGVSLLDILKNFGSSGLADWRMVGKTLHMYNPRTFLGDQSGATFRRGRDIKAAPRSRSRRKLGTVYLVAGDEGKAVERVDASAVAARGRKEQFISQGGVTDTGTLNVVGDLNLAVFSNNRLSKTHSLVFNDAIVVDQPRPWRDYLPGDYVDTDLNGTPENYRLVAMTISMGTDGFVSGEVTLNDVFEEREILLDDAITVLTGGSSGAGASTSPPTTVKDKTIPDAPTGLNGTSAVYLSGRGVQFAQVTLNWAAVVTNTDGTTIDDFDRYEIQWWYTDEASIVHFVNSPDNLVNISGLTPAKQFNYKVRACDSNAHKSAWSSTFTFALNSDTTAPPVPSTPVVTSYLGLLRATWDGLGSSGELMPLDFRYTEVWYSTVNNFTPGAANTFLADFLPGKGTVNISGLTYGTTYYVKFVSVDQNDNRSSASAQASGVPQQVVQTDIGNNVIDFSNVRFKDVGNLVPDGSFELATTQTIINTAQFDVVTNPLGATAAPSPKVLRCKTGTATYTVTSGITVSPDESYAMIYSFMGVGLAGADAVKLRLHFTKRDGTTQDIDYKTFNSTTNGATFTIRQAVYNTVPANAVSMDIQIVNAIGTAGAFLYLDEWEVRQQAGTVLIGDAAVTNALIANLAVNNAKIQDVSAGKLTVGTLTADITVSARIKTADTGARTEMNSAGFHAYNSSGTRTFFADSTTGNVSLQGQISSGSTGNRVVINPNSTGLPEIRFYADSGSNYGFLNGFSPSTSASVYMGLNSGAFTANGQTCVFRLYMTDTLCALETINQSTQATLGGYLDIGTSTVSMAAKTTSERQGFFDLWAGGGQGSHVLGATWGHNGTSDADDAWFNIFKDGSIDVTGSWVRSVQYANSAVQCDTDSAASAIAGYIENWGVTQNSQIYPSCQYRDSPGRGSAIDTLSTSSFGLNIEGGSTGASGLNWWGWR